MAKAKAQTYQLKITLRDSKPPIWRRVLVSGATRLEQLHDMIQAAMGWENAHLYQFTVANTNYGDPSFGLSVADDRHFALSDVVPDAGFKFHYEYDFGDDWQHSILVEKILPPDPKQKLPVCIKGKRSCPPEDVGGVWGYAHFLEAIQDPQHPEHRQYLEWIGDDFDPEAFDLDQVNQYLEYYR